MQITKGCQTVYTRKSKVKFLGEWDSKSLFEVISPSGSNYWNGKRVLDIGSNTTGLSLEIAYCGASVVALEPDPYNNNMSLTRDIVLDIIEREKLDLTMERVGLFDADKFGDFDVVLCLGLLYHFRDPQYVIDYLSTIKTQYLFISTQTHPEDSLALFNRKSPGILPEGFLPQDMILTGWHPTRKLFERMLNWAGFEEVESLTDMEYNFPRKQKGLTNSSYFRATQTFQLDPEKSRKVYFPR